MQQIATVIPAANNAVANNLQTERIEIPIPKEIIEKHINEITQGDFVDCLHRITFVYIPNKNEAEKKAKKMASDHPLSNHSEFSLLDHDGRIVSKIGSYENDPDGRTIQQMHQYISTNIFRHIAIEAVFNKHEITVDKLIDYFSQSIIFHNKIASEKNLRRILSYYINKDFFGFLHTAIPQIENMIRELFKQKGLDIYQTRKGGGTHLIALDQLLRHDAMNEIFDEDGNIAFYFRVVLTDQRGFNLRNIICHGLSKDNDFSKNMADIVFHILLVFAELKPTKDITS